MSKRQCLRGFDMNAVWCEKMHGGRRTRLDYSLPSGLPRAQELRAVTRTGTGRALVEHVGTVARLPAPRLGGRRRMLRREQRDKGDERPAEISPLAAFL